MGGAVKAVTNPIQSVAKEIGRVTGIGGSGGGDGGAMSPITSVVKSAMSEVDRAKESEIARRRARRGARALLSEARLNPELGVGQQTLGSGPMA